MLKYTNWATRDWKNNLLCLIGATIPFTINLGNFSIILAFLASLYLLVKGNMRKSDFRSFSFYFPVFFFVIVLISALSSKNIQEGLTDVDKKSMFVLIPVLLFVLGKQGLNLKKILTAFVGANILATAILLVYAGFKILTGQPMSSFFFHNFSALYNQHAVYFALYLALSFFILWHYYFDKAFKEPQKNLRVFVAAFIFLLGLLLTASKAVIFIFMLLSFIKISCLKIDRKKKGLVLLLCLLLGIYAFHNPIVKKRFVQGLSFDIETFQPNEKVSEAKVFSYAEKKAISDLELRYLFLKIGTYHLWHDQQVLFGYGVGDVQGQLDYYYLLYNLAPNWFEDFNLHNQYLQIVVSMGIFVFIFFMSYLCYSYYKAIKTKNILHLYFLLLVTFVFFFECLLDRNKGIVLFVFFNTLFLVHSLKNENRNHRNTRNPQPARRV